MKIRKLTIKNCRGIKALEWSLPAGSVICLIGKSDASKSTILDGIQYAFHTSWNLSQNDSDFHQGDITTPIVIEVAFGELTDERAIENFYEKIRKENRKFLLPVFEEERVSEVRAKFQ